MKRFLFIPVLLFTLHTWGQVYILNEDFSTANGTVPPANWSNTTVSGQSTDLWHFDNPGSRTVSYPVTSPFAVFDAGNYSNGNGAENAILETPFFDASIGNYTLLFLDHLFSAAPGAKGTILAFDGITWTEVVSFSSGTDNPRHEVIDLTAICAGKTNAKLRFRWEGDGDGYWAIDNVKIYLPKYTDAGISTMNAPVMPFGEGLNEVKVTLFNYGYQELTKVKIKWSVNEALQPEIDWTGNLQYGHASPNIALGSYGFTAGNNYLMKFWTEKPNDVNDFYLYNDTLAHVSVPSLCGEYTIGGTDPDFNTFNQAVAKLTNAGVSCPVVFKVRNGTYLEQIEIKTIPGSSSFNTVTFESESGDSSKVLIWNPGGIEMPTIMINNAKNLIFNKIGVRKDYNWVGAILMENAENITISHCALFSNQYTLAIQVKNGSKNIVIAKNYFNPDYSYTSKIEVNNAENVYIVGNKIHFKNNPAAGTPQRAIYGSSGINNLFILDNDFYCTGAYAITLETGLDSIFIINNRMRESGISISSTHERGLKKIKGNRITTSTTSGILVSGENTEVSNNYITISGINYLNGIEMTNCADSKIVHNSINLINSNNNSKCIFLNGGNSFELRNNIFSNPSGGYSAYVANNPTSCIWDYNNYFNLYNKTGFLNGSIYPSFSAWTTAINDENHGLSCNPFFLNDSTLIPQQILLHNAGIPIPEVKYDIDSTLRNPVKPDIGAKEFSLCELDAGINAISSPYSPIEEGLHEVKVILQNQGTVSLTTVTINWMINGTVQTPFQWSGFLYSSKNSEIMVGSYNFQSGTTYTIKAWTTDPNNSNDCNSHNDTVFYKILVKLCGTYIIGGATPNFQTFSEAVSVLTNAGITCSVIFKVRNGTYNEEVEINTIPGSSSINSVTFVSESQDNSQVILLSQGQSIHPLTFSGAENVKFEKIGIKHQHEYGEHFGGSILIENSSRNISILYCNIISDPASSGILVRDQSNNVKILGNKFTGQFFDGYGTYNEYIGISMLGGNNIEINENIFVGLGHAINAQSGLFRNLVIAKNEVRAGTNGILINALFDSIFITNNKLIGSAINVNSNGSKGLCLIQGNRIASSVSSGIILTSSNFQVNNNYISIFGSNPWSGIEATNCADSKIVYNSINVLNSNNYSKCIFLNGGSNIELKNNIFSNPAGGYSAYVTNYPSSCVWNYNGYFNLYNKTGFINGRTYQSFSAWATAINDEANGIICNPFFLNDSTLIPQQILLHNAGIPIPEVKYDIDSTLRNPVKPDIGAKEFSLCELDAGINSISSPPTPMEEGLHDVKVILQNQGTTTLGSATINWMINGIVQTPVDWNGSLASAQNTEVTLGSYNFQSGTIYQVKAWGANPNNSNDCNVHNDTIVCINIYAKLCGTYTIGGINPNFQNFNEAVSVLNNAGITCPVVFKVRNGTYLEHIEIDSIPGSSITNTVTFESESGDSSKVVIFSNGIDIPTINLNDAKNIKITKIGIRKENPGSPRGEGLWIKNSCNNILISNCEIVTTIDMTIIINDGAKNITFKNNFISGLQSARSGLIIQDTKNIDIIDNTIQGFWDAAIYVRGCVSNINIKLNVVKNCGQNGYNLNYWVGDSILITKNKLIETVISVDSNGNDGYCLIEGNRITTSYSSGISANIRNCLIANNYITVSGNSVGNGININNSSQSKIVFNSINVLNNNVNSSKCLQIIGSNNLEIKNNIFLNSGNGFCVYTDNLLNNSIWDYNDYFSPYNYVGYHNQAYNTLSSWGRAINGDPNSFFCNPFFTNDTLLVPNQVLLKDAGIPIPGIDYDIDSVYRFSPEPFELNRMKNASLSFSSVKPDIGAKQFSVCANDAGINQVISPALPISTGIRPVKVILQNQGTMNLNSVKINWKINSIEQTPLSWSGELAKGQNILLTIGEFEFFAGAKYHLKVWTSDPNNLSDCDHLNDTTNLYVAGNPLPDSAGRISGLTSVYTGQSGVTYTVPPIAGATSYIWTLPTGATGSGTSNSITIDYDQNAVSGLIAVQGINITGKGFKSSLFINVYDHFIDLHLKKGWNIISVNTLPDSLDIKAVFRPIITPGKLFKVQDEKGNSLEDYGFLGGWTNNIGNLSPTEGYKVKVNDDCQFIIPGHPVTLPISIPLQTGWNIIGYPTNTEADGMSVVQQLIDRGTLIKVQDEQGNSIEDYGIFGNWINNIGNFKPGKGYKVKVSANETLTIEEAYLKSSSSPVSQLSCVTPAHFKTGNEGNGTDHMNINLVNIPITGLDPGDEIGVFDGDQCVGAMTFYKQLATGNWQLATESKQQEASRQQHIRISIPVSSTDLTDTPGFTEGHPFTLKLWKKQSNQEVLLEPEILSGPYTFQKHESAFVSLKNLAMTGPGGEINPDELDILIYPNPTDGKVTLLCNGFPSKGFEVKISNSAGQLVLHKILTSAEHQIDLSGHSRGIYYIEVKSDSFTKIEKVVLR